MQKGRIYSALFLLTALLGVVFLVASNRQSSAAAPDGDVEYFQFLPYAIKPSDIDMAITNMEIVQTVQRTDNSVPLVAEKAGYARIYAQTLTGNAMNNIVVSLTATRNGSVVGTETRTVTVPTSTSRGSLNSSVNIPLPASWLTGDVQLVATVDANNAFFEMSESNNAVTVNANFVDVPDLNVKIVPVRYTHTPNGRTYQDSGNPDPFSNWLRRTYPVGNVNITHNPVYPFTGNLSGSAAWSQLLGEMDLLKSASNEPSDTVFYALVPIGSGSNQWFFSGIAGIGYIGYRASVGLNLGNNDSTGALTGHEIGHNFGRRHAPCGGPSGVDGNYPYGNASIGEYGLDIFNGSVDLVTPNSHRDVMGYCSPEWMSDYTYTALLNDQLTSLRTVNVGTANQLYIQANLAADGTVTMKPIYAMEMALQQAENPSNYMIELLAEDGRLLATQPMNLRYAAEPGIEVQTLQTAVLLPNEAVTVVRIVKDGETVAERNLNDVAAARQVPAAMAETSDTITLSWGNSAPTIVRYSANGGETWQVLGINLTEGELTVAKSSLAGGNGRFEIITADAQEMQSQTLTISTPLPNNAPSVSIRGPELIRVGELAVLDGITSDIESGAALQHQWLVNGELVSELQTLSLSSLPVGEHLIQLTVTDANDLSVTTGYVVNVTP